jgi:hypothetical protein
MLDFLSSSRLQKGVFAGIAFSWLELHFSTHLRIRPDSGYRISSGLGGAMVFIQGFRRSSVRERNPLIGAP